MTWNILLTVCLKLQWDISDFEDGSYTLRNVGLGLFATAPDPVGPKLPWSYNLSHIISIFPKFGAPIKTGSRATGFNIESAGNDEYVVRLATLSG